MSVLNEMIPQSALDYYAEFIKADYKTFFNEDTEITRKMISEFTVEFAVSSTYIKVITSHGGHNTSVHSFIVNNVPLGEPIEAINTSAVRFKTKRRKPGFDVGTILKPASWKAPAKNFGRGNLLDKASWEKRVRWTGAS